MTIESLPAKWREGVALLRQHETPQEVLDTFEQCADELEAALATQPKDVELLALADDVATMIRMRSTRSPSIAQMRKWEAALRTLASRRVTVDTLLKLASIGMHMEAHAKHHGPATEEQVREWAEQVRRATAALQPDSGSKK